MGGASSYLFIICCAMQNLKLMKAPFGITARVLVVWVTGVMIRLNELLSSYGIFQER